jgi:hypothetical protein
MARSDSVKLSVKLFNESLTWLWNFAGSEFPVPPRSNSPSATIIYPNYLEKGKLAPSNAALVEEASDIIDILGDQVATPAEARQILGMETKK